MPDVRERLDGLPPDKRKLLAKLVERGPEAAAPALPVPSGPPPGLAQRAAHMTGPIGRPPDGPPSLSLTFGSSANEVKRGYQQFYDGVTAQLDATVFGAFSFFLN